MRFLTMLLMVPAVLCAAPGFQVRLNGSQTLDGRLIVVVSKNMQGEPPSQVGWGLSTQQVFGKDVDGWKPNQSIDMNGETPGHPLRTLADLPPGTYQVQAVLNIYTTFHRADGHVLKLHADRGEGQQWNGSPGNLYSKPKQVEVSASSVVHLELTETIPPIDPPKDTQYIRHVRVQSKLLSDFWGTPIYLEASVLVPRDFDSSSAHYPMAFLQGHFSADFSGFSETPGVGQAHQFYQDWTSGRLPRMLLVVTRHATPYYDDS